MATRKPVAKPQSLHVAIADVQVGDTLHLNGQTYTVTAVTTKPISQTETTVTLYYENDGEKHHFQAFADYELDIERSPLDSE